MKGATADPLVSTSSPPNTSIMTRIGNSQYFLRTRWNVQNSLRNEIIGRYCQNCCVMDSGAGPGGSRITQ